MQLTSPNIHQAFARCLQVLAQNHGVWIVGGWVRDVLLGLSPHDADFATSAKEGAIVAAAHAQGLTIIHDKVAQAHGIFRLHVPASQHTLDLACLRTDQQKLGVRHAQVAFTDSIEQDLSRRDLTINAMAIGYPLEGGHSQIIDPFGGRAHLQLRLLAFVGLPRHRLEEDPLRLLRVARFACLGDDWRIDGATCEALPAAAPKLARISFERVRQEMLRAMVMTAPARFWQVVARAQAQAMLLPLEGATVATSLPCAIFWLKQVAAISTDIQARLVAFFVGLLAPVEDGAQTMGQQAERHSFVRASLTKLRCSRGMTDALAHAVALFPWAPQQLRGETLARWLVAVGQEGYRLLDPALAAAADLRQGGSDSWPALRARAHAMVGEGPWPSSKSLAITGAQFMQLTKLGPGPEVGRRLQELLVWATVHGCLTDAGRLAQRVTSQC